MLASELSDLHISVTNVYAPADHRDSKVFLDNLLELQQYISGPWLLVGDFNLHRSDADKNTGHVNNGLCHAFNDTLSQLGVTELPPSTGSTLGATNVPRPPLLASTALLLTMHKEGCTQTLD